MKINNLWEPSDYTWNELAVASVVIKQRVNFVVVGRIEKKAKLNQLTEH